jgi:hypothetical protein
VNERMIELYKEACEFAYDACKKEGRIGGTSDHVWNAVSTGRFAELIVQECAKFLKESEGPTAYECAELIKQHFGVES